MASTIAKHALKSSGARTLVSLAKNHRLLTGTSKLSRQTETDSITAKIRTEVREGGNTDAQTECKQHREKEGAVKQNPNDGLRLSRYRMRAENAERMCKEYREVEEGERARAEVLEQQCKALLEENGELEKGIKELRERERSTKAKLIERDGEVRILKRALDCAEESNRRRAEALEGVARWMEEQPHAVGAQRTVGRPVEESHEISCLLQTKKKVTVH